MRLSGEKYGIGAHDEEGTMDIDHSPQPPESAWERMKDFYDEWYAVEGSKTDIMWGFNTAVLRAADLAFLLAVAAGKPEEKAQALDLLANAVDGWRLANGRQLAIINRLTQQLRDQAEYVGDLEAELRTYKEKIHG
jgi:hypothetical protein